MNKERPDIYTFDEWVDDNPEIEKKVVNGCSVCEKGGNKDMLSGEYVLLCDDCFDDLVKLYIKQQRKDMRNWKIFNGE